MQEKNIDFSVIAVLTENSLDYPDEIANFFIQNNIYDIGFNIDEIEGVNLSSSLEKKGVEERYRNFMKKLYKIVQETHNKLRIREFEDIKNFIYQQRDIHKGQFTPFIMINIKYNGEFSTFSPELLSMKSDTYGDFIMGNLLYDAFDSVYKAAKFKQINEDIQAGVDLCKRTCQYFSLCGGGAPSNKYFENGSFRTSETMYCRYTKKIITDIILADIESSLGLR